MKEFPNATDVFPLFQNCLNRERGGRHFPQFEDAAHPVPDMLQEGIKNEILGKTFYLNSILSVGFT